MAEIRFLFFGLDCCVYTADLAVERALARSMVSRGKLLQAFTLEKQRRGRAEIKEKTKEGL